MPEDEDNKVDTDTGIKVPKARLDEALKKRRESLARVQELEEQLADLEKKAATAETLAKQLEEERGRNATLSQEWETERAVWAVGLTDTEGIEIARHLHSKLPEKDRPKMADWLGNFKTDPSKAPKALQPYLPQAEAPPETPKGQGPQGGQRPPPTTPNGGGARPVPPAQGGAGAGSASYTAEQIRAIRERAQTTGDWKEYNEARPSILAGMATRR